MTTKMETVLFGFCLPIALERELRKKDRILVSLDRLGALHSAVRGASRFAKVAVIAGAGTGPEAAEIATGLRDFGFWGPLLFCPSSADVQFGDADDIMVSEAGGYLVRHMVSAKLIEALVEVKLRQAYPDSMYLMFGNGRLFLDVRAQCFYVDRVPVRLTQRCFDVLAQLAKHAGGAVSLDTLQVAVPGTSRNGIRTTVYRIRQQLRKAGGGAESVVRTHREGYSVPL